MLTGLLAWIIRVFQLWHLPEPLANIAYGLLFVIGTVLIALGTAINRRSVKASGLGFSLDATGGEPETPIQSGDTVTIAKEPSQ